MLKPIIEVMNIQKSFKKSGSQELLVLQNINLKIHEGEIVAILGKSGSGKSTLLRIIAGLINASAGDIYYRGNVVRAPVRGISMVFQTFALLPWLTVLQNVELGLEALGVDRDERRERAIKAIDMIGLDGFESALPKELSGGMRQRVGFARALVVDPDVLIMDEPFSALDVLTADNLKSDLLDIWQSKKTHINSILFVTHNIEEAALLADRIIILGEEGTIKAELKVDLAHPRNDQSLPFRTLVQKIYSSMTNTIKNETALHPPLLDISYRLPDADISELTGLLEAM